MARPPRILRPGAWYHLTARAIERRPIFLSDRDRTHFCALLGDWVERFGMVLHAYVLMDNHYHLLAETTQPNLSRAMQWLNLSYTGGSISGVNVLAVLWSAESGERIPVTPDADVQHVPGTSLGDSAFLIKVSGRCYRCQHDEVNIGTSQARRLTLLPC